MLPHTHAAFAVVTYRLLSRSALTRPAMILIGSLAILPDVIDKSLYFLGFFPSGRSIAHSLLAIGFCLLAGMVFKSKITLILMIAVALGTHIAGDYTIGFSRYVLFGMPPGYDSWTLFPLFPFVASIQPPIERSVRTIATWGVDTILFIGLVVAIRFLNRYGSGEGMSGQAN